MKYKIYFRADGGPELGLGHIVRCMALAHMLDSEFSIHFVSREIPQNLSHNIISQGFEFSLISSETDFLSELTGAEIVVLDHYFLDFGYQEQIKSKGSMLVCIDDLHDKEFVADLIINHSPGINSEDYNAQPYTNFALGLNYALLRPVFLQAAEKKREIDEIKSVLICFGGSDNRNFSKKVLDVVKDLKEFEKITVVLGSANPHLHTFSDIVNDNRIEILSALNEEQMCAIMRSTDLAIVPSSGILFEVIATGCIPLICYYADNQKKLFHFIKENNLISTFNAFQSIKNELHSSIKKIFLNPGNYSKIAIKEEIKNSPLYNLNNFRMLKDEIVKNKMK